MVVLIGFLAANTVLAALYAVWKGVRREGAGIAAFFLFLPGLGFLLYFLPGLLRAFLEKAGVDREAVLTHAFDID